MNGPVIARKAKIEKMSEKYSFEIVSLSSVPLLMYVPFEGKIEKMIIFINIFVLSGNIEKSGLIFVNIFVLTGNIEKSRFIFPARHE